MSLLSDAAAEIVAGRYATDEVVAALERALDHATDPHLRTGIQNALEDARSLRRRLRTLENAARSFRNA